MSRAPTARQVSGGCLCGGVRYRIEGRMRPVVYCHCRMCRKSSGHFVAASACDGGQLKMLADESLRWYASSPRAERGFCSRCGGNLFWRPRDGERVSIMAGTIDSPTGLKAVAHIHVGSASDYLTIDDGLPSYDGHGPDELYARINE